MRDNRLRGHFLMCGDRLRGCILKPKLEIEYDIANLKCMSFSGCKSKRPLVKTPPSQKVPELVKTSPNTKKKDWSKSPHFSKEIFQRNMGF